MSLGDTVSTTDIATQAELDAHVNDTSAAHAASAISFSPTGTVAATDAQAAIAEVASESAAATELAYVERTTNFTTTQTVQASADTALTLASITFDGSTVVWIECGFALSNTSVTTAVLKMHLWEDSTDLGMLCGTGSAGATSPVAYAALRGSLRRTPTAGAKVYTLRGWVGAASTGTAYAASGTYLPGWMRCVRA